MLKIPRKFRSVRFCLAAITGLFLVTGVLVLAVGGAVRVVYNEYDLFITQRFFSLTGFVIATGVIILLGSGLGFYAAYSEHFYFVAGFVILTLVILVFELAAVITSFGLSNETVAQIRRPMTETINLYRTRQDIAMLWDNLQLEFECCGVAGRHDWSANGLPVSCCHLDFGTISPFVCNTTNAHTLGCAPALGGYLSNSAHMLAVTMLVMFCFQLLISAFSGWQGYRSKFEEVELES